MSRVTPEIRNFAERLIIQDTGGNASSEARTQAPFHVSEKLRPHLSSLMGKTGFDALQSRALALASEEVHWLRAIHLRSDGSLEGLDELGTKVTPEEMARGRIALLAHLVGLMVAFIGDGLTMRLMREVWPKLSYDELENGKSPSRDDLEVSKGR